MTSHSPKRILISAPGSGSGKTTFVSALMNLFKERYEVSAYKCGPDFIDPKYHETVLGVPSKNLDPFFCDEKGLRDAFLSDAKEFNIIEGCMGLYDGLGISSECSTYDVASALKAPIILCLSAAGVGYSIIPVIKGFLSEDKNHLIKAVFLNKVTGKTYEKLKPVIEEKCGIKCIGFMPTIKGCELKSRHLGLFLPHEDDTMGKIEIVCEVLKSTLDFDLLDELALSSSEASLSEISEDYLLYGQSELPDDAPVIAVSMDEALNFYYKDNFKLFEHFGCRVKTFSPLHDKALPENTKGIYLCGGYPELYAKELSENKEMLECIRKAHADKMPIIAECGGFMYLQKTIKTEPGEFEFAGLIDGETFDAGKLVRFGYVDGYFEGFHLKGHEFHKWDVTNPGEAYDIVKASTGEKYKAYHVKDNLICGYPHFYFPSCPGFIKEFTDRVKKF